MIAAILDLHGRARVAFDAIDQMQRGFACRHDVVDDDLFFRADAEMPPSNARRVSAQADIELLGIADHAIDFRHGRECRGLGLRRAAGDDDARLRILAAQFADRLPRLTHGFRRHRAGVDHHRVRQAGLALPSAA